MKQYARLTCFLFLLLSYIATSAQSNALSFDASDKYVTVPHNNLFNFTNTFTIEAWINTASGSTRQMIAAKMYSGVDTWLFQLEPYFGSVKLDFYNMSGTSGNEHMANSAIPANTWCHVAVTFDNGNVTFYVNGVADGSSSQPETSINSNGEPVRIGAWGADWNVDGRRFNGAIDEVRFWNTARTAAEIKAGMYGTVNSNAPGLIGYYKMNEGSGQTVADASSNGLDGTLGADNTTDNDPVWVSSPVVYAGNGLDFDGNDDYVLVPYKSSLDVSDKVTIEAWVYPTDNGWDNILMKGNYGYGFALAGFSGGSGTCFTLRNLVYWDQSQCGSTIRSTINYVLNTWQHVAVSVEDIGSQLEIYFYLDGVRDGPFYSGQSAISNGGASSALYLGTQGFGLGNHFGGKMDEVRVWNTIRTTSQIQNNKDFTLRGTEPGLISLYSFNQGLDAGTNTGLLTVIDGTSNNNHGTLVNFALSGSTSNWVDHSSLVLPVKLLSFTAKEKAGSILLNWSTAQEQNSSRFEIERSNDGKNFSRIGNVAASGNSNYIINYEFTDNAALQGDNYYRLKQIDIDGKSVYSAVVKVNIVLSGNSISLLGNPVQDQLKAAFFSEQNSQLQLTITDITGASLLKKTIAVKAGTNPISIPLQGIKAGFYYIQATSGSWSKLVKFSKL